MHESNLKIAIVQTIVRIQSFIDGQTLNSLYAWLLLSADFFCNQFRPDQAPRFGSKMFVTFMLILKEIFDNLILKKNRQAKKDIIPACKEFGPR